MVASRYEETPVFKIDARFISSVSSLIKSRAEQLSLF